MSREDDWNRVSALAGLDPEGGIALPSPGATINRDPHPFWKTKDYTVAEMPADVMEIALACIDAQDMESEVKAIARAIMAERERCAKIAQLPTAFGNEGDQRAAMIAAAIRHSHK